MREFINEYPFNGIKKALDKSEKYFKNGELEKGKIVLETIKIISNNGK